MATPRFAWGIDIGNRALKAIKLVPTAEGLVIDDFDVVEHETVLSASGDNRDSLISTALATFVGRHPGIDKGQVGVSVNGQRTFAKFIKLPPVETRKIPEIVRFEAIQQIPFPLEDVEWAYHLFQEPDNPDVEVGIFAMRKELVNSHIGFFTTANLNVQVVQMSPLSVYNALYYDSRLKGTTMIVDVGAESTDLIIAEGEGVWLRSIPIGGNNFTEALCKPFKVDFDKAEELKRNAATSKYSRQIVQNMRPIFADLVSEIQRSMGFYGSTHKESKISRVIALGNTFRLPGLQRYLQQNLTLEVAKLDHLGTATIEDPNQASLLSENLLSAAGAYGLALQVMGQGKINSSLLPEHIRHEKIWREKNKWFAAAAALFVAGAGVAYGSYFYHAGQTDSTENQALRDKIKQVEGTARGLNTEWDAVEQAGAGDRERIHNVDVLTRDRGVWPQINTLLRATLPQFAPGVPRGIGEGSVEAVKAVPRGDRKQVVISAVLSKYSDDLTAALAAQDLSQFADPTVDAPPTTFLPNESPSAGMAGGLAAATGVPAGPAKRGYIVTLRCVTPNKEGAGLIQQYLNDLQASPPTLTRPWKVSTARIVKRDLLSTNARRMGEMVAAYNVAQKKAKDAAAPSETTAGPTGGGGIDGELTMPGGRATGLTPGGAGTAIPDVAYHDPQTDEDVRSDTEAIVVAVIELDAPPPPPVAPAPPAAGKAVAVVQ